MLEHIPDDLKAMEELYRVLKKGGTLIAQVPLEAERSVTFEDNSITDKAKRTEIFGQYDHVRIYGKDYYQRLESVGFKTEGVDFLKELSTEEIVKFALPIEEQIPVGRK